MVKVLLCPNLNGDTAKSSGEAHRNLNGGWAYMGNSRLGGPPTQ